ncbi:MAG TPA: Fic family protein [Conexivisphaerales archaeon]|nr:Fic family protein [Conexivisphaerales archaeon]
MQKLRHQFEVEYTYHSNAIEGNTLTLGETQLILEEGITVGGKTLREVQEAKNHPDAIEFVEDISKGNLREEDLLSLHGLLMKDIDEQRGRYRTGEVRITGSRHIPPPPYDVPSLMRDLLNWLGRNQDELRPVELAAVFQHRFLFIHPFHDGNGRMARLLTNMILLHHGYPPIVLQKQERKQYYSYLSKADKADYRPFVRFVALAVEKALDLYLRAIGTEGDQSRYMTLKEASKASPYSMEYLSLLSRSGRIGAVKEGRNWRVSERALHDYVISHRKSGKTTPAR